MVLKRAISANERLYLAGGFAHVPLVIELQIRGRGKIKIADLRRAMKAVLGSLPHLRFRLEGSVWIADGSEPRLVLEEVGSHRDWKSTNITIPGFILVKIVKNRKLRVAKATVEKGQGRSGTTYGAIRVKLLAHVRVPYLGLNEPKVFELEDHLGLLSRINLCSRKGPDKVCSFFDHEYPSN